MTTLLAVVVGGLYATGFYMMLRRSLVRLIIGLIILAHAANLLIFTAAGLSRDAPPIVRHGETALPAAAADPLPQALILTAIVISLGVLAFAISLFHRTHREAATEDLDRLRATDT